MKIQCECLGEFKILSLIPKNGQVNFICSSCQKYGFILNNRIFCETSKGEFTRIRPEDNEE